MDKGLLWTQCLFVSYSFIYLYKSSDKVYNLFKENGLKLPLLLKTLRVSRAKGNLLEINILFLKLRTLKLSIPFMHQQLLSLQLIIVMLKVFYVYDTSCVSQAYYEL